MNVTVVGGKGKLGSVMAEHISHFYPTRIADRAGGEATAVATKDADIVLVIVNTPSLPDGQYDVSNVIEACAEIDVSRWRLVMVSSTVNPGDVEGPIKDALERDGKLAHWDFGLAYLPEFVRQGSVLQDFAHPAFVIAGALTQLEYATLTEFYETVCSKHPTFMSIQSAEIAKIGLNTMLTAKLGKANEIAWLCQRTPGADAKDVLGAIGQDPRIGYLYLNAGPPPGGPCLPRDDRAFSYAFQGKIGLSNTIAPAVTEWSRRQIVLMAKTVLDEKRGRKIGVAGLSFKPGISDDTESAAVLLADTLGAGTETYDPVLPCTCASLEELVSKCDVIVLACPFDGVVMLHNIDLTGKTVWDWWGMIADGQGAFRGHYHRFGEGREAC